jgi:hypothetical protein
LIEPSDKRYVRGGKKGRFTSGQADIGPSLSVDRRSKAKTIVKKARPTAASFPGGHSRRELFAKG